MKNFTRISGAALTAVAVLALSGSAFATTPKNVGSMSPNFVMLAPGGGNAVDEYGSHIAAFNSQVIGDLLSAKSVNVIKFEDAWTDQGDMAKAFDYLDQNSSTTDLLHNALDTNPQAKRLLANHQLAVKDILSIVDDGGAITIYTD